MQNFQPLPVSFPAKPELNLDGACGYRIDTTGRVVVEIESIANTRNGGGVSGTLSVELWALKQPYQGDYFEGVAVAGTQIGELYDQHSLNQCRYELNFQEPPAGSWRLSLMLREWDGTSYVTRDFVNFDHPYVMQWTPVVLQGGRNPELANQPEPEAAAMPNLDGATEIQEPATPVAVADTKKTSSGKAAQAKAEPAAVNLNTASLKQVAALKGVSQKVAEAIVAARPFSSLDALLKVKGVGQKLLEKLRDSTTL